MPADLRRRDGTRTVGKSGEIQASSTNQPEFGFSWRRIRIDGKLWRAQPPRTIQPGVGSGWFGIYTLPNKTWRGFYPLRVELIFVSYKTGVVAPTKVCQVKGNNGRKQYVGGIWPEWARIPVFRWSEKPRNQVRWRSARKEKSRVRLGSHRGA